MTKYLINYAKELQNNLVTKKIGIIENYNEFNIYYLNQIIDLSNYKYEIIKKENIKGYFMNWHLDNAKLITHKKNFKKELIHNQILISDRHGLYYYLDKPDYSLIIYDSNYNEDFKGGVLEFLDGTKLYPKKGMYVLFDSNELHRVHKVIEGTRISYLIKFYHINTK